MNGEERTFKCDEIYVTERTVLVFFNCSERCEVG